MDTIFASIITDGFTITSYIISMVTALICGAIAAFSASVKTVSSKSFLISLLLLPVIVQTVITMVNGNIGTGVAVMGAFSLVRFRSIPGKARDIAVIFLTMTAGLACAAGYVVIAILFTVFVCTIMICCSFISFSDDRALILKITVPETLNFHSAFDDVFSAYTKKWQLVNAKTVNMGSLYKLTYKIELKNKDRLKEFIDEMRTRNGNLEVSVSENAEGCEAL